MIRYFLSFTLLFSIAFTKEYPLIYSQLGDPLYKSVSTISTLSNIDALSQSCSSYISEANATLFFGSSLNTQDKKAIKEYLQRLRKLQKKYDKTLYSINGSINNSIDKNEYEKFLRLTDCNLEGILKSRALLKKSINYYKKNKTEKKSNYL